ncbi:glycoside hydrolase family 3 protein [Dermabacter hominis]|uniref:glycoside hydrolase family 3 protein n=1 Tax=Dermabacter hominis TaxID=36740 RepID=UPI00311A750E
MILTRGDDGEATVGYEPAPEEQRDLARRILERLPEALPEPEAGSAPSFEEVRAGRVSLEEFVASVGTEDLIALAYGDTTMDSPLGVRGNAGALGGVTGSLRERGVAPAITTDGPSGLRVSAFASLLPCGTALASTWNPEGVRELAELHAEEMLAKGSDILLSPGMNIQRDPLCGRNFEYFSEDPLLTGLMGAAVVNGVQSKGVAACPKHYAANNQEHNRIFSDSRVSERALREIYLRGFQIMVEESQPQTIMTSYNKINGVWGHYSYDLVTTILRGEFGFDGLVMTDWWMRMVEDPNFPALRDSAYRVRGGIDVLMPGSKEHGGDTCDTGVRDSLGSDAGLTLGELQRTALHVLRFILEANPQGHATSTEKGRRNLM